MNLFYQVIRCLVFIGVISFEAGAFNCETQNSGDWHNANNWVNCNNNFPQHDDAVVIKSGHELVLSQSTLLLESLFVEVGGDLDIGPIIVRGGEPIPDISINANDSTNGSIDLENAQVELFNDLVINSNFKIIKLGQINGEFNIILNGLSQIQLKNTIGGVVPVRSLTTTASGETLFSDSNGNPNTKTIHATLYIEINNKALLVENTTWQSPIITVNNTIDSFDAFSKKQFTIKDSLNAIIVFNEKIGSTTELSRFNIFNSDGGTVYLNTSEVKTTNDQRWDLDVILNSPTNEVLISASAGSLIRFGKANYVYSIRDFSAGTNLLTIATEGEVHMMSNVGDSGKPLKNLFINTPTSINLMKDTITVDSTMSFMGPVTLSNDFIFKAANTNLQSSLDLIDSNLTIDANDEFGSSYIAGVISGSGDLIKNGTGDLGLNSVNSLTGNIHINDGSVFTDNDSENVIPTVPTVSLGENGIMALLSDDTSVFRMELGQKIAGNGTLLGVTEISNGSAIEPGVSADYLTGAMFGSDFAFETGSELHIDLNGTAPGTDYDQLNLSTVNLDANSGGGVLLSLSVNFVPVIGDQFSIVTADSAVVGTFNGINEGDRIEVDGFYFIISYSGGNGNDVVLTADGPNRYYVNHSSLNPSDGTSWEHAFNYLQDALEIAIEGDEVWIADGVYYPDQGVGQTDNDVTSTFNIPNGLKLMGGFEGSETSIEQRDLLTNITVLSGDVDLNDTINANGITATTDDISGSNAYHVVTSVGNDDSTMLDGLVITAGKSSGMTPNDRGAAVYCNGGGISLNQVTVQGNHTSSRAALWRCFPKVIHSHFINNRATGVGAVAVYGGTYIDSTFEGNIASSQGAVFYLNDGELTLSRVILRNNSGSMNSAIRVEGTLLNFNDVLLSGNHSRETAGVINLSGNASGHLTNVTITGNKAGTTGGGIHSSTSGNIEINNSIFWNNLDNSGVGTSDASIYHIGSGMITFNNSILQNSGGSDAWNSATLIDGGGNLDVDPLFLTDIDPALAPTSEGNAQLNIGSLAINAGNNALVTSTIDLAGSTRIQDFTVDLGPYEYLGHYFISGTVTGLLEGNSMVLGNGQQELMVDADGGFIFSMPILDQSTYDVEINRSPESPIQPCQIQNGSGIINGQDVIDIEVNCELGDDLIYRNGFD